MNKKIKNLINNKRVKAFAWGLLDAVIIAALAYSAQILYDMEVQYGQTAAIVVGTLVLEQVTKHYNGKKGNKKTN